MFKIGDKVQINSPRATVVHGCVGTVVFKENMGVIDHVVVLDNDPLQTPRYCCPDELVLVESNAAIIVDTQAPVMVEGKMPVHSTRKQLLGMFTARKVMKADYANRNNTLSMRLAARNAHTELCSRIRCELANGARTRIVPYGWDKV